MITATAMGLAWMLGCAVAADEKAVRAGAARVHWVTDLSHEFTSCAAGGSFRQYLAGNGNGENRNWGTLRRRDHGNAKLLVLMSGATSCARQPEDIRAARQFREGLDGRREDH